MKISYPFVLLALLVSWLTSVPPVCAQNWVVDRVAVEDDQVPTTNGGFWVFSSVACSADGSTIIMPGSYGGNGPVCISTNLGATWQLAALPAIYWTGVTCSSDGTKMAIVAPEMNGGNYNTFTIYTSSDGGVTWTPRNGTTTPGYVNGYAGVAGSADGTKLVALANGENDPSSPYTGRPWDGGVYLSSDSGATWYLGGSGDTNNYYWRAVASSGDGNTLAGVGAAGIYLSHNAGATWQPTALPPPSEPNVFMECIAISADGSKMVAGDTDFSAAGDHLYTSTNSGATWTDQPGAPQGSNSILAWGCLATSADGTKLVAGSLDAPGTLYTSSDSGVTWESTNNAPVRPKTGGGLGWLGVASSADGLELVAIPQQSSTNYTLYGVAILQPSLFGKIVATPQGVQIGDSIQVVVTVINADTNTVTNVSVNGAIVVTGTGGVTPAGFSGPTLTASLAPGATTSFTYLYTATNYGTVNFAASATGTGPDGVLVSPTVTSGSVVIAPRADLMIKTASTNDTTFAGMDEFQQPPPYNDQNWTLRVGNNGSAGYVVRLQNDTATARTFALVGAVNSYTNWNVQVLSGNVNIFSALTSAGGWTTPLLAPGADLDLPVTLTPLTGASVLENKSLLLTALADSSSTNVLDAVILHAILVPVPVQATLLTLDQSGLTPASIAAGLTDINAPLVPVTDPTQLEIEQEIHGGLVADDVTPMIIKLDADPASIGQYASGLDFVFQANILGGGTLNGNSINQRLLLLQNGAWQVATDVVLTANSPTAYVQLTPISSDDVTLTPGAVSYPPQPPGLDVDFSMVDNTSGVEAGDIQFGVRKPPIALLHGYNTAGDWGDDFIAILQTSRPVGFVRTVKYGQDQFPGLANYVGMPVYENTVDPLDECAALALASLNQMMSPIHATWAFTRYDVVAHSQGGVLARMLCNVNSNALVNQPFRNPDNFNRGRFNRVVTIGSPHNGTRLLRFLLTLDNTGKFNLIKSVPQVVATLGVLSEIAQAKFDPFGPQFAEVNDPDPSAPWYPDQAAMFHLVRPTIDYGSSPVLGDFTLSYLLLGMCSPDGGTSVIPRGSDGVVDFDSMGANVPPAPVADNVFTVPSANLISHSQPIRVFGSTTCETESTVVAQHVIDALDQNPLIMPADETFDSFPLPPLLDESVETLIDDYATNVSCQILPDSIQPSPAPHFAGASYQYQLAFPTNLPVQGTVDWFVQVYGPAGITSDGVELSASGTNDSQVTVTVDEALVGDVVLSATYVSTNNIVVVTTPVVVVSKPPVGATLTGIQVLPTDLALPPGSVVSPQVVADYSDGSSSLRYATAGSLAVVSSQPSVVSVSDPLNWQLSAAGTAQVTVTWSGFSAVSDLIVFDPSGSTPPALSLANAGNGQLTLSWPGSSTSYVLQSTSDLRQPNSWQPVLTIPVNAGGQNFVSFSTTNVAQFYRLQPQP